ncbi:MAG: methyltransferase domain-containing protein [Anaerolineae bacterium]|nr:methyltransferase domain-containing protein [Anaerolineae bacterium]
MAELLYCCPRCHGELDSHSERYECNACSAVYPIISGIPDFRVYPDPYISLEDDRKKGQRLADQAAAHQLDFRGLVAYYYSITPEVPPDLGRYYENHHVAGVTRGVGMLERLAAYGLAGYAAPGCRVLDLGCGTGGFVLSASEAGADMVGVDIAFRWLIAGRHRLREMGHDTAQVVCACADYLPFRDAQFDLIVSENVIEHTAHAAGLLAEANRVRKPGHALMARTVNRFAIGPEPHVGVWGVGFLPRRWMDPYVRRVKGIPYEHIHLQSVFALRHLLADDPDLRVTYPRLMEADYQHHPESRQRLFRSYAQMAQRFPLLRPLLTVFGPYLEIVSPPATSGQKTDSSET